jgi:hypothetical protein
MSLTCKIGTTTCDITTCHKHVKLEQPHVILPHVLLYYYHIILYCYKNLPVPRPPNSTSILNSHRLMWRFSVTT